MSAAYPYSMVGKYEAKYGLSDVHDALLRVLTEFDRFCKANGIQYSLGDGTLLGAIRHGDFVPWDDDADVMVTREEYNKIRNKIKQDSGIKLLKISFLDRITIPEFEGTHVFVDLFINDEMPKSKVLFAYKKMMTRLLRCHFANQNTINHRRLNLSATRRAARYCLGAVCKAIANLYIGKRDVWDLNDAIVSLGSARGSGIYTRLTSRMYETKRRFDKESYNQGYEDIVFRGVKLMALKNAATFLKEMYGDYQSLPPEDKRAPEHAVEFKRKTPDNYFKYIN